MLNLSRLSILDAVARGGSIGAAGELIGYTPSAVSQQIHILERELKVQLILRGARGSTLTPAGAELVERGRSLMAQAEAAIVATQETAALRGGLLRVCTFPSAGATFLPRALACLRTSRPGLEIRLLEREPLQSVALVERHEVDIAFTFVYRGLPPLDLPPPLFASSIRLERMLVAVPHGTRRTPRTSRLGDIDLDWIDNRDWGAGLRLLGFLAAREGIDLRTAFETDDYQIALGLVAAGLGAALVPETVAADKPGIELRELKACPRREIVAVTRGEPQGSAQELLRLLSDSEAA